MYSWSVDTLTWGQSVLFSLSNIKPIQYLDMKQPHWAMDPDNMCNTDTNTSTHTHTRPSMCRYWFSVKGQSKHGGFLLLVWQLLSPAHKRLTGKFYETFPQSKWVWVCVCVTVFSLTGVDSGQAQGLPDFQNETWLHNNNNSLPRGFYPLLVGDHPRKWRIEV